MKNFEGQLLPLFMVQLPAKGKIQVPQSDQAVPAVKGIPEPGQRFGDEDREHEFIYPINLELVKSLILPVDNTQTLKKGIFLFPIAKGEQGEILIAGAANLA